jgi:hypothetical protein
MATSEIEKLERRYAENPQGLTFAPLAEVHRKSGDVARALELLRAGLELHPNYIPASIVLGRCQWDLGDLPAAEAAFAHVLRLDDENVIALKSLADINERLERFGEAQRWLHRLISVDRSNEEARQQLSRLESAKERGSRKAESKPEPATKTELPQEITAAEPAHIPAKSPVTAAAPPAPAKNDLGSLDLTADIAESVKPAQASLSPEEKAEAKSATLEFLDTSKPARPGEPETPAVPEEAAPVDGLISQEFVPPKEATYRLHPELTQEFVSGREPPDRLDVEITEEIELRSSGAPEFRVPNAAEDFMDLAARINAAPEDPAPLAFAAPAPEAAAAEPPVTKPVIPEPSATGPSTPKPAAATPSDPAPSQTEPPPVSVGLRLVTEPEGEAKLPSYSARETKGQSIASFFQALLAARPAGNSGPPGLPSVASAEGGGPTRAADDMLSLSSVFGEESGKTSPPVAPSGQTKDAAVSFDDFFRSAAGGPSAEPKGGGDPSNDDLDQFQSWLQNLKR